MARLINWEDKINSPELLAYLKQFGAKSYLSAGEINELRDKLNSLNNRVSETAPTDRLIENGGFFIEESYFHLKANSKWEISGVTFSNVQELSELIQLSPPGLQRRVIVLLDTANSFYIKSGEAAEKSPQKPVKDENTIELTDFFVSDTLVTPPTEANTGSNAILKNYEGIVHVLEGGSIALDFQLNGANKYNIWSATEIRGWNWLIGNGSPSSTAHFWGGKSYYITNCSNQPIVLKQGDFLQMALDFPSGLDMVLPIGATAEFFVSVPEMKYVGVEFKPLPSAKGSRVVTIYPNNRIQTTSSTIWYGMTLEPNLYLQNWLQNCGEGIIPNNLTTINSQGLVCAPDEKLTTLELSTHYSDGGVRRIVVYKAEFLTQSAGIVNPRVIFDQNVHIPSYVPSNVRLQTTDQYDVPDGYVAKYIIYHKYVSGSTGFWRPTLNLIIDKK